MRFPTTIITANGTARSLFSLARDGHRSVRVGFSRRLFFLLVVSDSTTRSPSLLPFVLPPRATVDEQEPPPPPPGALVLNIVIVYRSHVYITLHVTSLTPSSTARFDVTPIFYLPVSNGLGPMTQFRARRRWRRKRRRRRRRRRRILYMNI